MNYDPLFECEVEIFNSICHEVTYTYRTNLNSSHVPIKFLAAGNVVQITKYKCFLRVESECDDVLISLEGDKSDEKFKETNGLVDRHDIVIGN